MSKAPISDIRVTAADTGERKSGLIRFLPAWLIANASNPTRRYWMLSILILAIAAGLRLVGLFDDFWLD